MMFHATVRGTSTHHCHYHDIIRTCSAQPWVSPHPCTHGAQSAQTAPGRQGTWEPGSRARQYTESGGLSMQAT